MPDVDTHLVLLFPLSTDESETFNVEDEILRKRTERSVADHDVSHESMMVTRIHQLYDGPSFSP